MSNKTQEQLLSDKIASFVQNCKISGLRGNSGINIFRFSCWYYTL